MSSDNPIGRFVDEPGYSEISRLAGERLQGPDYPTQFGSAWTALEYRTCAAEWHAGAFSGLLATEPAAAHPTRVEQERELFGFITNAAAAADVFAFVSYLVALAAAGVLLDDAALAKQIGQTWSATRSHAPALANHLQQHRKDTVGQLLFDDRNTLVHRGFLARHHTLGLGGGGPRITIARNPKSPPSLQIADRAFNPDLLNPSIAWLELHLKKGLPLLRDALLAIPPV